MVSAPSKAFFTLQPGHHLVLHDGVNRNILERSGHSGTLVGDHLYVIGGRRGSRFYTDLLRLNLKDRRWEKVFSQLPFHPRANHIAVAVKHNIWLFGGADNKNILSDVWILDTTTLDWSQPQLSGRTDLLSRCAGGADIAPTDGNIILVCGGYGCSAPSSDSYDYFNDLIKVDTQRMRVEQIATTGIPPSPRCFHTFTTLGKRCYVLGGRRISEENNKREHDVVAVYDHERTAWLNFMMIGERPQPRSSHRVVAAGDRLIMTGGLIDDAFRHTDADIVVTLRPGDDHSEVAQLEWTTEDQPPRCIQYDWPQGRGGHACCLYKNQVMMVLGYTGYKNKVYMPDVLCFDILPYHPTKPLSSSRMVLSTPLTAGPEPLITPALNHPAAVGAGRGGVSHTHHQTTRHIVATGHLPASPLAEGKQQQATRGVTVEAHDELDVYAYIPSLDRDVLARQSRIGTGRVSKNAEPTAVAEDRVGRGPKAGATRGARGSKSPVNSPVRIPEKEREELSAGSPGDGGWRLSKSANLVPHAMLLPLAPLDAPLIDSGRGGSKRQRTGRSPGPADGGSGGYKSGAGASPADVAGQPAAEHGRRPAEAANCEGRCLPGRASNQVERLQVDVQRLQEELKRAKQSEAASVEQAKSISAALAEQKTGFEMEYSHLRTKLAEREAIMQSKSEELLSTQHAYGEAVRQAKDHQRQVDQVLQEKREVMAECARMNQELTLLSQRVNDSVLRATAAETKVTTLEVDLRSCQLQAHEAMNELKDEMRKKQASYDQVQQSYATLTENHVKNVKTIEDLKAVTEQQKEENKELKQKLASECMALGQQRDAERHLAEAAKAEVKCLQQRVDVLEHNLGRQNVALEDSKRELSGAKTELSLAKANLEATREELSTLRAKHEEVVRAGVEIAQDLRGSLEQALHARDRSTIFGEEYARMQAQERERQLQAEQQAQQNLEQQLQQRHQQSLLQRQQQQQTLQQTELQLPQLPSHSSSDHALPVLHAWGWSGSILGPPPQICGAGPSNSGNPGQSNAVT